MTAFSSNSLNFPLPKLELFFWVSSLISLAFKRLALQSSLSLRCRKHLLSLLLIHNDVSKLLNLLVLKAGEDKITG
ncbi:hypothetical protein V6N12_013705 [Hibiscus sabdariffa]|uniref:Uncharacterized protein n=1 Tax=Hibiscus sabdariffa TaxID=183260 RepID=A0ABR2CWR5_9ROSI